MELMERTENGVLVLAVSGRLDAATTPELEEAVLKALKDGRQALLLDFSRLEYINSSGLRVLVMAYQRLREKDGALAVCGLKDYIQEVFAISGYDKLFGLYADQAEAVARMA